MKSLFLILLIFLLLSFACNPSGKMYPGPRLPEEKEAVLMIHPEQKVLIIQIDDSLLASSSSMSYNILPGKHRIELGRPVMVGRRTVFSGVTSERYRIESQVFILNAEAGHTYLAKRNEIGNILYFRDLTDQKDIYSLPDDSENIQNPVEVPQRK